MYKLTNIYFTSLGSLVIGLFLISCSTQKQQMSLSGNPIVEGWYADPEGVIFDDKFWVYPTYSAQFEEQVFLDAFSSDDLTNWKKHSRIIDTASVKWAKKAMWAPCIVKKDSSYFLFFAANDLQAPFSKWWNPEVNKKGEVGGIGIGISSKPEGPFRDYLGKPLIGEFYNKAQPIDQFVFQDQDGSYYIIYGGWGRCNIARLNDDFTGLEPYANDSLVRDITPEGYVEGPFMFIREGKYYLMWSEGNWTDETYKAAYGIADSPFGPFKKLGIILESDPLIATGAGHHSVVNVPGSDDWYVFYHRRPIPNEGRDHRVVCVDRMFFNTDGTIQPIKMTKEGVDKRER